MASVSPILDIQHLSKRIGDLVLLDSVSMSIFENQRVGLIAKNGTGKTTLLNILAGGEDYESGNIVFRRDLKVGYLEQSPRYDPEMSVMEACFWHGNAVTDLIRSYEACMNQPGNPGLETLLEQMEVHHAWDYENRIKQILTQLNITDFDQKIAHLSGGQLKRVALANVLLTEPEFLILDEPTNHLDLQMIEWLEDYLQRSTMTLLMVTHDRYFLDRVCSAIIELDGKSLYTYNGNYAYYLEKRQERIDAANAEIARANNLYRRELDWMRRMPCARGHKARYREEAFYELEKIARRRMEEKRAQLTVKSSYIGNKIIEINYISKAFSPDKVIVKDFVYTFARYEKMGIVGNNGTGKSTFIRMLLGMERPDAGRIVVGETVRFGYYSQEGLAFDNNMKVIDVVRDIAEVIDLGGGKRMTASQFLQYFLFTPETQHNYVYKLSGGERRRLYLCTVLMRNPNFLVLDEPTNDLDIVTLQILEEYLQHFQGCVIVVSHDRYFMDKVVDHLLVFEGEGAVRDFPGNYSQYREWKDLSDKAEAVEKEEERKKADKRQVVAAASAKETRPHGERKRRLTFKEHQELDFLSAEVDRLETEKKQIEEGLSSGTLPVDELVRQSKRLPLLEAELEEKSMRWLELSEYE